MPHGARSDAPRWSDRRNGHCSHLSYQHRTREPISTVERFQLLRLAFPGDRHAAVVPASLTSMKPTAAGQPVATGSAFLLNDCQMKIARRKRQPSACPHRLTRTRCAASAHSSRQYQSGKGELRDSVSLDESARTAGRRARSRPRRYRTSPPVAEHAQQYSHLSFHRTSAGSVPRWPRSATDMSITGSAITGRDRPHGGSPSTISTAVMLPHRLGRKAQQA